jgi:hypothetical protein
MRRFKNCWAAVSGRGWPVRIRYATPKKVFARTGVAAVAATLNPTAGQMKPTRTPSGGHFLRHRVEGLGDRRRSERFA